MLSPATKNVGRDQAKSNQLDHARRRLGRARLQPTVNAWADACADQFGNHETRHARWWDAVKAVTELCEPCSKAA